MKKILTIILAMSMVLSLTACGDNESAPQSVPASQATQQSDPQSGSKPENSTASTPDSSATSTPESSAASNPENSTASTPDSSAASNPDSSAASNPDSSAASNPDSSAASNPDSSAASDPESSAASDPENSTASTPDSSTTSENEGSTEVKAESDRVEKVLLPLKEYPAGSYFTADGKPCTDHDTCDWDKPCNCVNFDNSIQSVGFARYAYFKVNGKHVSEAAKTEIDSDIDEQTARANLKGLPCGAYIAVVGSNDRPHTMTVISTDDNGITVYQANYGGKCVVSAPTYSWSEFAARFPHLDFYAK